MSNPLTPALLFLICASPGSDVLTVFNSKCAGCHSGDKPQGKFGYVLDLKKVAANKNMVISGDPDRSDLWRLVLAGNMPPFSSPTGPLTPEQKDAIKRWIESGAPADLEPAEQPLPEIVKPSPPAEEKVAVSVPFFPRLLAWLGKFHLLILHFPIVLTFMSALAELWRFALACGKSTSSQMSSKVVGVAVTYGFLLATLFSVLTVVLGWLHAISGAGLGQPDNLFWHRWLGTGIVLLLGLTAYFVDRDMWAGTRRYLTMGMIFAVALLMGVTGHLGGMMVHGRHFLDY